jgi:hypothetical protein
VIINTRWNVVAKEGLVIPILSTLLVIKIDIQFNLHLMFLILKFSLI